MDGTDGSTTWTSRLRVWLGGVSESYSLGRGRGWVIRPAWRRRTGEIVSHHRTIPTITTLPVGSRLSRWIESRTWDPSTILVASSKVPRGTPTLIGRVYTPSIRRFRMLSDFPLAEDILLAILTLTHPPMPSMDELDLPLGIDGSCDYRRPA